MKNLKILTFFVALAILLSTAGSFATEDQGGGDTGGEGCACALYVKNTGHCTYRWDSNKLKYFYKCSTPQVGEIKDCKGVIPCEQD